MTPLRIDPAALAKYGKLALVARAVVEGFLTGAHKSPYKGFSVEFAEHRQYYPGDEIRHIDWRVFGKTDRYYIKEYEEETNLQAHLLVDASGSMGYRGANGRLETGSTSKFAYAQVAAASLAYLMLYQLDAVGLIVHDIKVRAILPPHASAKHLFRLLKCLEDTQPRGETSLAPLWHQLAGQFKRRGMVIILSDCFDQIDPLLHALRHLRHRGHEVLLFHLLAPEEIEFPFEKMTQFRDLEASGKRLLVDPRQVRREYLKNFSAFCDRLRTQAGNMGIDYHRMRTDEPVDKALGIYLTKRRKRQETMGIGFVNVAMLAGLAAVLIPPLVHLLSRRRHQVVDWGAMQFLQFSQTTRRRLLLEELVLMALRMGLVAILVLALAAPYALTSWLDHSLQRDVVLVVDGSSSMTMTDGIKKTPFDVARDEARAYLQGLLPGDRVALLLARRPPELVVGELSRDFDYVRAKIEELPSPRGNPDWPRTLTAAQQLLRDTGKNPRQEIILFTDNQRFGLADPGTLSQWERLAPQWRVEPEGAQVARPRIVAVNTARDASRGLPNYALAPLKSTRTLAWMGQTLKFSGAVNVEGLKEWIAPQRLYCEVDGKFDQDIDLPASAGLVSGRMSFSFSRRFAAPGAHLVSVIIEPDVPPNKRPPHYQVRDFLPADNRQDLVIEVVRSLPVLLVDGDNRLSAVSSTFFLDKALAATPDGKPAAAVAPRAVPARDWTPAMLEDGDAYARPRVVILADVPDLTPRQSSTLEKFVAEGGGVLIVLGPRLAKAQGTYLYHQNGTRWLSTRLEKIAGDAAKLEFSVSPDPQRIQHPALELFQEGSHSLAQARFPRWWQVTVDSARATLAALLTSGDPLLVEQTYKKGRVLVCTVPLDRSWGATFPSLWDYPVFVHELVFYLADARSGLRNLQPGQPLRVPAQAFADETGQRPERLLLVPPEGKPASLKIDAWPWIFNNTGVVGPYRLEGDQGKNQYFVVHGDARESDLTPCTEEDRQKIARWLPVIYGLENVKAEVPDVSERQDLWWLFLLGVILLLCGEAWWTRRMVRRRTVVSTNEG